MNNSMDAASAPHVAGSSIQAIQTYPGDFPGEEIYRRCELCPRRCGVDRTGGERGFCRMGAQVYAARSALHFWEEPCISGNSGSGTIFFSGCSLRCVFCQNASISKDCFGREITVAQLADMMRELKGQGAHNINLVTATHFAPQVAAAVQLARSQGMDLPIVWNSSGYERPELLDALSSTVDIWLFDFKYAFASTARQLSGAADYPEVAAAALAKAVELLDRGGGRHLDDKGIMRRGIVLRHLLLPSHTDEACAVVKRVWEIAGNAVDLSLMNQYTPQPPQIAQGGPLSRTVDPNDYDFLICYADTLGFEHLIWQEESAASAAYTPVFDGTGVRTGSMSDTA